MSIFHDDPPRVAKRVSRLVLALSVALTLFMGSTIALGVLHLVR